MVQDVDGDLEPRSGGELSNGGSHDAAADKTDALHRPNLNMVQVAPAQGPSLGAPITFQGHVVDDAEMQLLRLEPLRHEAQA